jgi:hypothetical protein
MNQRLLSLVIAGLVVSIGSYAVTSAQPQHHAGDDHHRQGHDGEVEVLVNGTPQRRYAHQGRWYVEAVKGREYAIQLRNPYPVRVAVALSVDGLNTIDARHTAAADARKWVLAPYETVTISGWQTSRTDARRFEFTTEARSYAQALGKTANLGMISAVFFKERVALAARETMSETARSSPAPSAGAAAADSAGKTFGSEIQSNQEYAATGMGRRTDHAVTLVHIDLEPTPAQTVNIRYEYRDQLVRLGILRPRSHEDTNVDPMQRRERARGFEPGFSPEPPRR